MSTNRYAQLAVLLCAAALLLAGCGGGGVSHSAHSQLQDALDDALAAHEAEEAARQAAEAREAEEAAARAEAEAAEAEAEAARLAAEQARQEAEAEAAEAERLAQEAEAERLAAEQEALAAEEAAAQARHEAQEAEAEAAEVIRTREASQRAQYLQAEMLSVAVPPPLGTDVIMNVPSRGRLELTRPGTSWRMATLGGAGLRSATMPLTSNANTGKTVVYTDRELSRPLLDHFGFLRDPNNLNVLEFTTPGTLTFSTVDADGQSTNGLVDTSVGGATAWQLTLPLGSGTGRIPRTSATSGAGTAVSDDSYALALFGMSGQLLCPGCEIELTPTYSSNLNANGEYDLQTVAVASSTGAQTDLRFDPSGSPSVNFYNGADFLGDLEYMVFGYWREDPRSPASPYDSGAIGVFADAVSGAGTQALPATINATYRGTAVGMYVEQELADPIDTHRQGEFVANAILTVAGANASISGTIRDFAVTPTGGSAMPHRSERWVIRLLDKVANATNPIVLNNESGSTTGEWNHEYVQAHEYAGRHSAHTTNRDTPPGVTGTFNARIGTISRTDQHVDDIDMDALHIIGAFGAHQ